MSIKKNGYDCVGCDHPRDVHKSIGEGGCQQCTCTVYLVEGIAWVIQSGIRWMQFSERGEQEHSWPCTNLGDARMFSDKRIAEQYVHDFQNPRDRPWVVREVLVTPLEESKGLEG